MSIKDVLEDEVEDEDIFLVKRGWVYAFLNIDYTRYNDPKKINVLTLIPRTLIRDNERQRRVYSVIGSVRPFLQDQIPQKFFKWRWKITPLEYGIQGIPDNYTRCVSNTQRYKMIGNGFSVPTISNFLKNMGRVAPVQPKLFKWGLLIYFVELVGLD